MSRTTEPMMRLARNRDAALIARISRLHIEAGLPWTWRAERVAHHIQSRDSIVVLATRGAIVKGFAIMEFRDEIAGLCLMAVCPPYRRHGVASALVRWLELSALTAGIVTVHIEVRESNAPARTLYAGLEYREIGRCPGYYSNIETAVRLERRLRPDFDPQTTPVWRPV